MSSLPYEMNVEEEKAFHEQSLKDYLDNLRNLSGAIKDHIDGITNESQLEDLWAFSNVAGLTTWMLNTGDTKVQVLEKVNEKIELLEAF
ncbi:hypothetical protein AGMMS50268_22550 [Spirochaetia bacterium]|nr:hypothetical protein AGMMS50268_22550 [Spirochaetia bacterium]